MQKAIEHLIAKLEMAAYWDGGTYDEDGYSNDDAIEVVNLSTAISLVEEMAKTITPDWIPASEGSMPKEGQKIYATIRDEKGRTLGVVIEQYYKKDWQNGTWEMKAWIPLPENYEEEKEKRYE